MSKKTAKLKKRRNSRKNSRRNSRRKTRKKTRRKTRRKTRKKTRRKNKKGGVFNTCALRKLEGGTEGPITSDAADEYCEGIYGKEGHDTGEIKCDDGECVCPVGWNLDDAAICKRNWNRLKNSDKAAASQAAPVVASQAAPVVASQAATPLNSNAQEKGYVTQGDSDSDED